MNPQTIPFVSHELKNCISPICSLSEIIKNQSLVQGLSSLADKKNELEYLQAIEDIQHCAYDALRLIDDLMEIGVKGDEFDINIEEVDVVSLIKKTVHTINYSALSKSIAIIFNPKKYIIFPKVNLDYGRTKQILLNLLSNSIKYSPRNTVIVVNCSIVSGKIVVSIKDQGIGMTKDHIAMALSGKGREIDKSQLHQPIDSHGFGMPLVKKLMELQKGELEIYSEVGKGTEVILKFNQDTHLK